MHLYLLVKGPAICDLRAAVELLKECYNAKSRGPGYGLGLVFATDTPVSADDMNTLGLVSWV